MIIFDGKYLNRFNYFFKSTFRNSFHKFKYSTTLEIVSKIFSFILGRFVLNPDTKIPQNGFSVAY